MGIFVRIIAILLIFCGVSKASVQARPEPTIHSDDPLARVREKLQSNKFKTNRGRSNALIFDLPVTYNGKVSKWISYFQTRGSKWFRAWLERSTKFMPLIQNELTKAGMPTDLAYLAMIESGFSTSATSHAEAVGPWQFIASTANRYGLQTSWWLDERRDVKKSTLAAIRYMKDLYDEFGSWYLVAASYNMGENGLRRKIVKFKTKDYWQLMKLGALPDETEEYVPKILAAMLIAKAPGLYGFRGIESREPLEYEVVSVPGGTDLEVLADHLGLTRKALKDLNSELTLGYVPRQVRAHYIRVPLGARAMVGNFLSGNTTERPTRRSTSLMKSPDQRISQNKSVNRTSIWE